MTRTLRDAERTARALLARFEPGEHIAVWAPKLPEWLLLEFGAGLAGMVIVTVNPACRSREVEYVLRQSKAVGLFHVAAFRGNAMAETVAQVRPGLPALRAVIGMERWDEFVAGAIWIFVDEFLLTGSGKIQKFVLRERWDKGEFAA